jgi:hypothetical protein
MTHLARGIGKIGATKRLQEIAARSRKPCGGLRAQRTDESLAVTHPANLRGSTEQVTSDIEPQVRGERERLDVHPFVVSVEALAELTRIDARAHRPGAVGDRAHLPIHPRVGEPHDELGRDPRGREGPSDCALQASQKKQPFYVAYDLPGMTIGVAGNSEGKGFAVQSQQPENAQPGAVAEVQSEPCPSEVRLAQSGRVTCFAPGSFGMNSGGGSPHGGMTMPPATGQSPHGGMMTMPPTGMASPHGKPAPKQEPAPPSKTKQ